MIYCLSSEKHSDLLRPGTLQIGSQYYVYSLKKLDLRHIYGFRTVIELDEYAVTALTLISSVFFYTTASAVTYGSCSIT